jgi:hypothetical protein
VKRLGKQATIAHQKSAPAPSQSVRHDRPHGSPRRPPRRTYTCSTGASKIEPALANTVEISDIAERQIRKLEAKAQRRLIDWLEDRIEGCKNPRHFG